MRFPILRFGVVSTVVDTSFRSSLGRVGTEIGYYLGTLVECVVKPTSAELVTQLMLNQLDAAWVSPVVALDCGSKRVAFPRIAVIRQHEIDYHAVLFSREDSSVRSLADLRGARAAWVSPESASGYIVPLASLRARGVSLSKVFASQTFFGSHEAVTRAVAEGKADVGASFAHFDDTAMRSVVSASWTEANINATFRVLLSAGPIPTDVIVIHKSMDEPRQQAVVDAFAKLCSKPEIAASAYSVFHCDGFVGCGDEHIQGLRKLTRLLDTAER